MDEIIGIIQDAELTIEKWLREAQDDPSTLAASTVYARCLGYVEQSLSRIKTVAERPRRAV